jgi:hypothetical protein
LAYFINTDFAGKSKPWNICFEYILLILLIKSFKTSKYANFFVAMTSLNLLQLQHMVHINIIAASVTEFVE